MKIFLDASFLLYILAKTPGITDKVLKLYSDLLSQELYTDSLVLDEVIYVAKKKYRIPPELSIEFIDEFVLPYVQVLSIGIREYLKARDIILEYNFNPSDALHLAVIENYGLQAIVTEDEDFDRVPVKRIWV
ncbi:twitching motility protein PilT [Thermococcus chitonophagus]|uniref:Ribonuclease VapC n=1 Tax=Thermococcus chitonophagus TaxID=54262 RepID=A0A170SWP9_9EURY|nr:type II toxin-antitoxin system VapC family toxin [Thermococcus chitonophagus]ASJ16244.1 twitching motility protein PilT [Thermococcus chitonophagus]CUX78776.1 hypothetical protein CHITON_1997 [Thermococcus chitonophagus]